MRASIKDSYRKAHRVIISCTTKEHLVGANNYINSFMKTYSYEYKTPYNGFTKVQANAFTGRLYDKLRETYEEIKELHSF